MTTGNALVGRIMADRRLNTPDLVYYISNLPVNSLCRERCVLYLGCNTGTNNGKYNLVDSTFDKGAHFVLGTTANVRACDVDIWLENFIIFMQSGEYSIQECLDFMSGSKETTLRTTGPGGNEGGFIDGELPLYYRGDTRQFLK